jgi:TRAP-type C4-dicarboxylate transport system substrate-binding protein
VSRKWYEVAKYVTPIHYVPLVYPVQVNKQWWQGLTQDQRDLIKKAVASTEGDAVASIEKEFKDDIALLKKHGNKVHQPTDKELSKWKKATEKRARKNYLDQAGDTGKKILHDLDTDSGD